MNVKGIPGRYVNLDVYNKVIVSKIKGSLNDKNCQVINFIEEEI